MPIMSGKLLAISVIIMFAVIMGLSAVTPAMAGNHGASPPEDVRPCDALDKPSDDRASEGKDRAIEETECD